MTHRKQAEVEKREKYVTEALEEINRRIDEELKVEEGYRNDTLQLSADILADSYAEISRLRERVKELEGEKNELMSKESFDCPDCPNQGWYEGTTYGRYGEPEPEQCQCQFCYTVPNSTFNKVASRQAVELWEILESFPTNKYRAVRVEHEDKWYLTVWDFTGASGDESKFKTLPELVSHLTQLKEDEK